MGCTDFAEIEVRQPHAAISFNGVGQRCVYGHGLCTWFHTGVGSQ